MCALQERNKPLQPPKAPEQAPFFLQTSLTPTSASKFTATLAADDEENGSKKKKGKKDSKIVDLGSMNAGTALRRLLEQGRATGDCK